MKHRGIIILVLLVCCCMAVNALDSVFVGLKLGFTMGRFYGKEWKDHIDYVESITTAPDSEVKNWVDFAFYGSFFVTLNINRYFGIQPEMNISQMGGGLKIDDINWNTAYAKQSILVMELPVLFKGSLYIKKIKQDFYAGPNLLLRLNKKIFLKEINADGNRDRTKITDSGMLWAGFAVTLGMAINFPAGPGYLFLDSRINFILTNFNAKQDLPVPFYEKMNIYTVNISGGYALQIY